jgi:SpoIIAA-like
MINRLQDMPEGTIGFEFSGGVTGEEYRQVLEPPLEAAVEAGEVRLLLQTAADFDGMKLGARIEDAKANIRLGVAHRKAWKRVAIVTDSDWLRTSFRVWSHFVPVEMKIFAAAEAADARVWVAAP